MCRESLSEPFPVEDKEALYLRAGGKCEYPGGCNEREFHRLTIDHFTPVCMGKLLGWQQAQIDDLSNLQLLCGYHHRLKDATTEAKKAQVLRQMAGRNIRYGRHI